MEPGATLGGEMRRAEQPRARVAPGRELHAADGRRVVPVQTRLGPRGPEPRIQACRALVVDDPGAASPVAGVGGLQGEPFQATRVLPETHDLRR